MHNTYTYTSYLGKDRIVKDPDSLPFSCHFCCAKISSYLPDGNLFYNILDLPQFLKLD